MDEIYMDLWNRFMADLAQKIKACGEDKYSAKKDVYIEILADMALAQGGIGNETDSL